MRHGRKVNHLSRKSAHRKAMLQNMASSLILHKRIHTTLAKAKALRTYIEPLITKSKEDTTHSRRVVFSELQSKEAVTELFREVSVKVADRPGGYTRIIKIGNRLGDNAELCMMELVDFNENLLSDKQAKGKTTRKRRGSGKKKTDEIGVVTAPVVKAGEETAEIAEEKNEVTDKDAEVKVAEETVTEAADEITTEIKAEAENTAENQVKEDTGEGSK